jgi:Uma2 family endonuclease
MVVAATPLTYAEFLKLPETRQRCEVINGELRYMTPAPTTVHQRISRSLFRLLDSFVVSHSLGEVFYSPLDVLIRQAPLRVRQPDLLFISQQRLGIIGRQHIDGGPDLVVDILSSGNTRVDLEEKLADYAAIEVQEGWRRCACRLMTSGRVVRNEPWYIVPLCVFLRRNRLVIGPSNVLSIHL